MQIQLSKAFASKASLVTQLILVILWGTQLLNSDAYYVNYVLLLMIVAICTYMNIKAGDLFFCKNHGKYNDIIIYLFTALFTLMVACSNYQVWSFPIIPEEYGEIFKGIYKAILTVPFFLGGFCAFGNIFVAINSNTKKIFWNSNEKSFSPKAIFAITFIILVFTRWMVLYFCQYPGELTPDSMEQMVQLVTGNYSNHHPFYHTIVIKFFVLIGLKLFNNMNAAVATFIFFQILFTAMCFSFAVSTMTAMKAPRWTVVVSMLFYILMPYHIIFAITMWKDVLFSCFILLFATFVYRSIDSIGYKLLNYIMLSISCLGICLFRSNGFLAFIILTIVFAAIWRLKHKKTLLLFIVVIIISFIMKYPVLDKLGVEQPDTIESLSIPAQQIARVVKDGCELTDWQRETLSRVIDIEQIPDNYWPFLADPIKNMVRRKGNQQLIVDQKGDYIKLYLSLGLKYPMEYMQAWIDQTRGYWNAGYEYWRWDINVDDNDLGIEKVTRNADADRALMEYLWMYTNLHILRILLSIGTFVWIDIVMLMIALLRKDKIGVFVTLPVLAVVASLLVATPVFAEFRYIYSVFCVLPLVIMITLRPFEVQKNKI